jgi:class 3 adenylate cyclase/DNA-binding beta-propeller fold protein YncE
MRDTGGMLRGRAPQRVLATVLFTDIVGSTELAARLGDRRWRDLVGRHHRLVRRELKRRGGREIDVAGDGFFALFDRPVRAIECATAIVEGVRSLGLEIRAGVHTGEVELRGRTAGGIAVHIGARVLAAAAPGEILVTATLRDLVAGSGTGFEDRGASTLKGVPGEWHLFAVVQVAAPEGAEPVDGADVREADAAKREPRVRTVLLVAIAVASVAALAGVAALLLMRPPAQPVVPAENTVARLPANATAFDLAVPVGTRPTGIVLGEGSVWVINFTDQTLSRIDASTGQVLANPAVGGTPTGLAVGAGAIWVTTGFGLASGDTGSVIRFNVRTGRPEGRVDVASGAEALAFGENALWVADRLGDQLLRVDPAGNAVVREIAVARAPSAVAVGEGSVWVASSLDRTIWRIDPDSYSVDARISLPAPPIALYAGQGALWATSETGNTLMRIDALTNALITSIDVGKGPRGVAAMDGRVWIAVGGDRKLVLVDPATNAVIGSFDLEALPDGVAVGEDGAVWLSLQGS